MRLTSFALAALGAALLVGTHLSAQSPPNLVNYQGVLTDAVGQPLTGDHSITVNIFGVAAGGTATWGPQTFDPVTLDSQGRFNIVLGPNDGAARPISSAFGATDRFLEITVDGGSPIAPRQQFLAAPYSYTSKHAQAANDADTADHATTADSASNGVLPGMIMPYAGTGAPSGWLLCDGSEVSRAAFPELFGAIGTSWGAGDSINTFNLPDLRGRFLRGVDMGVGRDPDSGSRAESAPGGNTGDAVGSVQGDATARPNTNFTTNSTGAHTHSITTITGIGGTSGIVRGTLGSSGSNSTNSGGAHTHSITGGGDAETRPLNAGVVWIIKN